MVTTTDMVSYYKFDESSGDAIDAHGSNDGTVNGATQGASGKINDAYSFDGVNDSVATSITASNINNPTDTQATISLWFYSSDIGATKRIFSSGSDTSGQRGMAFFTQSGFVRGSSKTADHTYTASDISGLSSSTWYHLVVVVDDSSGVQKMKTYLNGAEQSDVSPAGVTNGTAGKELIIANRITSPSATWAGSIDEIGVWDRALTATEVSDLYNSGSGLAYPFTTGATVFNAPFFGVNF